jgi:putative membrane protein
MFTGFHTMGAADWVLMTLFWVALLALVAFAVVRLFPTTSPTRGSADRRLASGELDVEAYQQLKAQLDRPSRPPGR